MVNIILDTDLGCDCDDAGALAVLHALADSGEVKILAIGSVNPNQNVVPALHAINTWFGRPDIPIGTLKRMTHVAHDRYLAGLVREYRHSLTYDSAPDAVQLYREVLAQSPDQSVTLVAIGPATNISDLLDSSADQYSPLNGIGLVRRKLCLYAAGGNGRGTLPHGTAGWNYQDDLRAARNELAKLPTDFPTIFAGGSGNALCIGNCYHQLPADHIIRRCYVEFFQGKPDMNRPTWDQLRVLYAGRPSARKLWDLSHFGDITVDDDKSIHFEPVPNRNRAYAYVNDLDAMRQVLEPLMLHTPAR